MSLDRRFVRQRVKEPYINAISKEAISLFLELVAAAFLRALRDVEITVYPITLFVL